MARFRVCFFSCVARVSAIALTIVVHSLTSTVTGLVLPAVGGLQLVGLSKTRKIQGQAV